MIMKKTAVYTTKGDDGLTSLFRGERVFKDDTRVEAYGSVDELSACIGMLQSSLVGEKHTEMLSGIQNRLFAIACFLADTSVSSAIPVDDADIKDLEKEIDDLDSSLPCVNGFLLPSSEPLSALANVCRTVCRRAERRMVSLAQESSLPASLLAYTNRLSDYLFVLSRVLSDGNEKKWEKPCK